MFQKKTQIGLIGAVLILALLFSGCVNPASSENTSDSDMITITDAFGRNVTLPDNPERIAVSGSGSMRYFVYLEVSDRAVAVDYQDNASMKIANDNRPYALAHPEIRDNPMIGTAKAVIDAERLMAANPDVLFVAAYSQEDVLRADEIQQKTGIPVVLFYTGNYVAEKEKIDETFRMLGKILHKEQRANDLIAYFEETEADLKNRIKDAPAPNQTVYVGGVSYNGAHGLNGTNPSYLPFIVLNLDNAAKDMTITGTGTGYALVSKEKIVEWDPDVIFVDLGTLQAAGGGSLAELKTDPSYKELTAAKTGNIYAVNPYTSMNNNHETSLANCYYVGKILYPEQFKDIDPAQKADEIYTFVVGKPVFEQMNASTGGLSYTQVQL
ncbi:hypothetical protein MsAg5_09480 [Methanosarcinaceae archaeon Ag5]|uniref:Fe/B12 periplasmic-binding domain-containing protein n=1 Tax=Methanolapillus africanus TaxID=3028297 RepID=A0AAE4MJ43_9EURY|nr:hypothetical protein [Methanosarcinaceae archaeon Ag5]